MNVFLENPRKGPLKDQREPYSGVEIIMDQEDDVYPILPIRDVVIFPGVIIPLFVGRPRSMKAIENALLRGKKIFVVAQKKIDIEDPDREDLYDTGTLCNILQMVRIPDGTTKVLVEGITRMKIESYLESNGKNDSVLEAHLLPMPWRNSGAVSVEALKRRVLDGFERYNSLQPRIPGEIMSSILAIEDVGQLVNLVGSHLSVKPEFKQRLLEKADLEEALSVLLKMLVEEIDILELEHDIQDKVRSVVDKQQKEYYLREQLRIIQDELGQNRGEEGGEFAQYEKKIETSAMSEEARSRAQRELDRLAKMPSMSPEAAVVRNYLDWLIDLPWGLRTVDNVDIAHAARLLEEDHYGLNKVKDRILEFLAVRRQAGDEMKAQIICFVGPPGVGKTSLGRSIARALDRKFVNVSLGGVRDEAEIRGHRRTYIGSLPGRIIQKLVRAGSCNPVILLDEIDKLGNDFRGDPASALLEVLDPRQNYSFADHYLEVPFDLSEVLFITTANVTHTIPKPLLDRMEIIKLSGYTNQEKTNIALQYLFPRVLKEHGLATSQVKLSAATVSQIASLYTREAGVRGLERELSTIARKITRNMVEAADKKEKFKLPVSVKASQLKDYLGPPKLYDTKIPKNAQKGNVVGLAWTEAGGDVLLIEAVTMKGKGDLALTGNLGDVMQESARAAVSFLRAESEALGIGNFNWKAVDIHVHVPDGAVPKDGPSAGVTMATAILSAVSGRKVNPNIAMTGEISLRGHVLPVGGIREKLLAAKRYGISHVILPEANKVDVEEIPVEILGNMRFDYASEVEAVFKKALAA
ncbi:MAG: endopeptidase La [Synergistaceae bacterium]|jgi:ATP-dependent Lon protease|nr:endopeptidase La [Synergistaceae bacterium]